MAERKLGTGTTVIVLVLTVLFLAWAYREYGDGGIDDLGLAERSVPPATTLVPAVVVPGGQTAPVDPLVTATAASVVAPPSAAVVPSDAYQLRGVVVDHDVANAGTVDQRFVLQVFLREYDAITYVYVSEAVWRACPVPGEFVIDHCVDSMSYRPELPTPAGP